ncbi:MAG: SAM-dependent methyltransferase [Mangrovibacterium sp.]
MANLYLIPITLGETEIAPVLPSTNSEIIKQLKHFIVENVRTARRFLKQVDKSIDIDTLTFYELNKHTDMKTIVEYLQAISEGMSIGVMSEAGCPGIADPGAEVVRLAHEKSIKIIPLVGPSSIVLAMMASGMNGQNFAFNGYLPINKSEKQKHLKMLETRIFKENQSQIFIEAPYRNLQLLDDLLSICAPNTKLCIACNLTCHDEFVQTQNIAQWKKSIPDIQKKPAIFILGS